MSIIKKRLREAFAEAGVDFENHVRFLPHLSPEKYQALNTLGDIALDTPEWSGGNTTLEALYQGLPVVTLPGGSMRSRVSAGMLSLMDVKDTIAADRNAFIEIGVRLGKDLIGVTQSQKDSGTKINPRDRYGMHEPWKTFWSMLSKRRKH